MDKFGGPPVVAAIAVVAALLVLLAVLHFGFRVFRSRKGKGRSRSGLSADGRVEVLETTVIDAERRLVLIRCDNIEHLVMVGGPADLVVENDVRKVRGPGAPPARVPGIDTERPAAAFQRTIPAATMETTASTAPKPHEATRPPVRPAADTRSSAAGRGIPPVLSTAGRPNGRGGEPQVAPSQPKPDEGASAPRPHSVDTRTSRRETAPVHRPFQSSPAPVSRTSEPLRPFPAAPANDRNSPPVRSSGRSAPPSPSLPAAQIPWSDPDSIENEIVRALRFDPNTRGSQAGGRREPAPPKATVDSTTTLGDLADRLEEALAREVQSANQPQRSEPPPVDFGFESAPAPEPERPRAAAPKEREQRRDRSEPSRPAAMAPPAEPESKREPAPAERREEAPVISLNSRRRESADQLEDEMARLLGELTSDNKGR